MNNLSLTIYKTDPSLIRNIKRKLRIGENILLAQELVDNLSQRRVYSLQSTARHVHIQSRSNQIIAVSVNI
jgi:hypothetical protein